MSGLLFAIVTRPSPICSAVSTDSTSLFLKFSLFATLSLSTTISILCLLFLLRFISLSNDNISPSTLTLTKPFSLYDSKTFKCCPFRPLITGARTSIFSCSFSSIMASAICPGSVEKFLSHSYNSVQFQF